MTLMAVAECGGGGPRVECSGLTDLERARVPTDQRWGWAGGERCCRAVSTSSLTLDWMVLGFKSLLRGECLNFMARVVRSRQRSTKLPYTIVDIFSAAFSMLSSPAPAMMDMFMFSCLPTCNLAKAASLFRHIGEVRGGVLSFLSLSPIHTLHKEIKKARMIGEGWLGERERERVPFRGTGTGRCTEHTAGILYLLPTQCTLDADRHVQPVFFILLYFIPTRPHSFAKSYTRGPRSVLRSG